MTFPARLIAGATSPAFAEPACSTTPRAPSASPARSATISARSDLSRISRSSLAQFKRYTAWISTASTPEPSRADPKAATSSSVYSRERHARGLWLKIWMAWQPFSTPRSTAFAGPPAGETWAPISMAARL